MAWLPDLVARLPRVTSFVVIVATSTLAINQIAMTVVLLNGLFVKEIDNGEIFKIIGPAFNNITGAFTGLVAGIALGRSQTREPTP